MDITPEQIEAVVTGVLTIIGAFASVAPLIPNVPISNPVIAVLKTIVNVLAMNIGNAKNQDPDKKTTAAKTRSRKK